jgi:cell fate regulator YaaT (PSP1 superfamily)
MDEETEQPKEPLRYIEFTHGKLANVRKIEWDPGIGEPVHGKIFVFRDEFGEDWGRVLRPAEEPEPARAEEEESEEEEEEGRERGGQIVEGVAVRYVTSDDERILEEIFRDEGEYLRTCRERVAHHGLEMKMLATDIRFDRRKITFHFAAEGRIDFRMLVRDLAGIFRCRIELHQIGARDEAKLYIGCGPCGRTLCCRSWLTGFSPIGIKMARAQNLPLNPGKISGNCGRLLCCLSYEYESYLELGQTLPRIGEQKEFDGVRYEVTHVNPLSQSVTLQCVEEDERHRRVRITGEEYHAGQMKRRK